MNRYVEDKERIDKITELIPGDIVDGKEIEQDGDITWTQEDHVESEGIS